MKHWIFFFHGYKFMILIISNLFIRKAGKYAMQFYYFFTENFTFLHRHQKGLIRTLSHSSKAVNYVNSTSYFY